MSATSSGCANIGGRNTGPARDRAARPRFSSHANSARYGGAGRATPPPHRLRPRRRFRRARSRQSRRCADAQATGDQLEQRQTHRRIGRIQPAGDDVGKRCLWCGLQRVHHLGQARRGCVGRPCRPHQRDRFGQIADIVIRPGEQHRIGARRGEFSDQPRLCSGKRQFTRDGGQSDAAVRVRLGGEIAPQQRDLRVTRRREYQAFQQFREGDHGVYVGAISVVRQHHVVRSGGIHAPLQPAACFGTPVAPARRALRLHASAVSERHPSWFWRRRVQERSRVPP